jgi:RimJ/RimL family protein N-acetyltransferase
MEPNIPSLHLLEKFGFQRVALKPDAYILETGELVNEVYLQMRIT